MLTESGARKLKPSLDAFASQAFWKERTRFDPIEFPGRYKNPRDVEVAGLLSATLAYGRVDLFKPKIEGLLNQMGASPAEFVSGLTVARAAKMLDRFVYRFNLGSDVAVLLLGMGGTLSKLGSLEAAFQGPTLKERWTNFTGTLRSHGKLSDVTQRLGPPRALEHLLPFPLGGGAAKRLNLYARWMVRGPDAVDFGVWKRVKPSELMIPLDTHIMRMARLLKLTSRKDASWKTAEEVTTSLRLLDASDPVRYDFALCHYAMSGACPLIPVRQNCVKCQLRSACAQGSRRVNRS